MAKVYLKAFTTGALCQVPIETLVTLFTIKYSDSDVQIILVKKNNDFKENHYLIDLSSFKHEFVSSEEISKISSFCELPNLEENNKSCIAGLCATLRKIIQNTLVQYPEHHSRELLGFKEACLLACAETSIWTKFCEVDIVSMVKFISEQNQNEVLPITLARFESHMSQPVRMHNLYKYVKENQNNLPEHRYTEGLSLTLADIIIFVCIHIFFTFVDRKQIYSLIPLTIKWYENMITDAHIIRCLDIVCNENSNDKSVVLNYSLPVIKNESLYKSDPNRYKPRKITRQEDIDYSLNKIKNFQLQINLDEFLGEDIPIDWSNIPYEATPEAGDLPNTRLQKKMQQLESLCKPILKLVKEGDVIVDFCSGGGHLGILLAYLLPKCNIILLENKAQSMKKAKERVEKLSLNNLTFYQSNIDYFKGHFDIGTCLHACGVATDLVLQQCIDRDAAFVCCPCCYGNVQDCDRIDYPRSQVFKEVLDYKSYVVLGHAADQTHDADNVKTKQGYECMMIIDTDRKLKAEEHGYNVYLTKLIPVTCSPKNHLLVGWPSKFKTRVFVNKHL